MNTIANPPIYIAFIWHMHQPIYWPGETVTQTESAGHYGFSVIDIFRQRIGPYTSWPVDAIESGKNAGLAHLGASVSFSGSLAENLDNLKGTVPEFSNWESRWTTGRQWMTTLGNPRLDLIGFSYYHSLNGLIEYDDIRKQIQLHKKSVADNFGNSVPYSKGFFPAETAFSPRMIPALVDESLEWIIVDNIHFDRACQGYPWNSSGNIYEPNGSDLLNPNPGDWLALNGLWAPTQVSAQWGHQPHYVSYTDPSTGISKKIIAVPGERYMGNEDGRGGFGALNYEGVISQLEPYNTDTAHPILIVLHHDGDNYGGGTDSYYHNNFNNFINWLLANPSRFVCTTIQDYLDMFPPDTTDIIHIEDGSWSGADNGDPEFKKWNGDPDGSGYSPDRNSWGVIIAGKNRVDTAGQINPTSANASTAHSHLLVGEASDYWYWEPNAATWDGHPTRAVNLATPFADTVIGGGSADSTGPTIYIPQREPYNPGGNEWGITQSTTFTVWSYVYDVSGLVSVNLKYRTDNDGIMTNENQTYAGGAGVSAWNTISMNSIYRIPQTSVSPNHKAYEYSVAIGGLTTKIYDYYIEATDTKGFMNKSPIRHVKVGSTGVGSGGSGPSTFWIPSNPTTGQTLSIYHDPTKGALPDSTNPVYIHLGYNYWNIVMAPNPAMSYDSSTGYWRYDYVIPSVASTVDFVFSSISGTSGGNWDNNSGQDWHVLVGGSTTAPPPPPANNSTAVWWTPLSPSAGSTLTVYYDPVPGSLPDITNPVFMHVGFNRWMSVLSPDTAMTYDVTTGYWKHAIAIPVSAKTVDFVFNNGNNTWDNNGNADWHVATLGATIPVDYVLDGILDTTAQLIAVSANSALHLWAHWNGEKLYLAAEKGSGGNDRFIVLAKTLNGLINTFWAKSGQVAQWDAFIGNEESNNWSGWFNASGSVSGWTYANSFASGSNPILEGTIELQSLLGSIPSSVYLASAGFGTSDGATLVNQAPPGNGNGNIENTELIQFTLSPPVASVCDWQLFNIDFLMD